MAASSLLALLDDIATLLDDVAILSKVAAKKTTGVLGDDLALNAEQVSGVKAERELPVVWAVMKGSFVNKLILVPAALLISALYPPLITVLLVIGGLFLCFEGSEKILHKFFHSPEDKAQQKLAHQQKIIALTDKNTNLVTLEKDKIKGAIRTDFILSAEIIVIILGSVKEASFELQVLVVSVMALVITVGVYGLVAAIVKIDDLGLYLLRQSVTDVLKEGFDQFWKRIQRFSGRSLLIIAPQLMKLLSIVGTIAMFLVGGGIIVHSFHWLHQHVQQLLLYLNTLTYPALELFWSLIIEGAIGVCAGVLVLLLVKLVTRYIPVATHH